MTDILSYQNTFNFFQAVLKTENSAALFNAQGECLHLKYNELTDIGSLPAIEQTCKQYLQLKHGEVCLANDPYSGGSHLSSLFFISCIEIKNKSKGQKFYFCKKLSLKPIVNVEGNIEHDGIRIPPTPIASSNAINSDILSAMAAHPSAPRNFIEIVTSQVESFRLLTQRFTQLTKLYKVDLTKPSLKDYLNKSNEVFRNHLSELARGEAECEQKLSDGSLIKLKIISSDKEIVFDFSGTSSSQTINLTNTATAGVCFGSLFAALNKQSLINDGVLKGLQIIAPQDSLVNCQFPQSVFLGMTDGASIIANLIIKCLGRLDPAQALPESGASQYSFELSFDEGSYYETIASGTGGQKDREGIDGFSLWTLHKLNPSIEEVERLYPILIESFAFRENSGGVGLHSGGRGQVKSITALKDCTLKWSVVEPVDKPQGLEGGKVGTHAEAHLIHEGEREKLPPIGSRSLKAGDKVSFHSSGGAGYGKVEIED